MIFEGTIKCSLYSPIYSIYFRMTVDINTVSAFEFLNSSPVAVNSFGILIFLSCNHKDVLKAAFSLEA